MPEKKDGYLRGAAILAAAVLIVKILGAVYKIALGNIIGDEGYAHFTVAYNIFALLLTLSTAGLPVALSRMISEADALGRRRQIRRIMSVATAAFCVLGLVGTAVMLFFPGALARGFDDPEAGPSILALAPSIFLCCLMSAYRGYTQGHGDMKLTSVSQVIETLVKVVIGVALAFVLVKGGKGLAMGSAGAIVGVSVGSLAGCAYSWLYVRRLRGRSASRLSPDDRADGHRRILTALIVVAIPVALGSSVLNLINLIDTKLVMNRLQTAAGFTYMEAKVLYGVYGKVLTLFGLPSAFVVPLTVSMIPAIASFTAQGRSHDASEAMRSSLKLTTLLGLPAGVGLSALAPQLMDALYSGSAHEGKGLMAMLGVASYFVCLVLITNAVFQSCGHERLPVVTMLIGGAAKILINLILVGNHSVGIYGAGVSTLVCYVLISALNLALLKLKLPQAPKYAGIFIKPALCSAVMGGVVLVFSTALSRVFGPLVTLGGSVIIGVVTYAAAIVATGALGAEDLRLLPGGEKLIKFLGIR